MLRHLCRLCTIMTLGNTSKHTIYRKTFTLPTGHCSWTIATSYHFFSSVRRSLLETTLMYYRFVWRTFNIYKLSVHCYLRRRHYGWAIYRCTYRYSQVSQNQTKIILDFSCSGKFALSSSPSSSLSAGKRCPYPTTSYHALDKTSLDPPLLA